MKRSVTNETTIFLNSLYKIQAFREQAMDRLKLGCFKAIKYFGVLIHAIDIICRSKMLNYVHKCSIERLFTHMFPFCQQPWKGSCIFVDFFLCYVSFPPYHFCAFLFEIRHHSCHPVLGQCTYLFCVNVYLVRKFDQCSKKGCCLIKSIQKWIENIRWIIHKTRQINMASSQGTSPNMPIRLRGNMVSSSHEDLYRKAKNTISAGNWGCIGHGNRDHETSSIRGRVERFTT